ncbi:type II secretion system F family protein, partial [Alicyclobacillus ferrooxydans]
MNLSAVLFGGLITLSVWLAIASRQQATKEFAIRVFKPVHGASHKPRIRLATYKAILQAEAEAIDEPEKATLWMCIAIITSAMVISLSVLLRQPAVLFLIPVVFATPLMVARTKRTAHLRRLREQTRVSEIMIAFLMKSGATLSDTLSILEKKMESPMREKIVEVNTKKRFTTLPDALHALAESTGITQVKDFAMIVSESETYGTPVADALLRSLQLD